MSTWKCNACGTSNDTSVAKCCVCDGSSTRPVSRVRGVRVSRVRKNLRK
ncbi:hypothetical protein AB0F39_34590 [Streptomyces murinus]